MTEISENLRRLVFELLGKSVTTITTSEVQRIDVNSESISKIRNCLSSEDISDLSTGFLFLSSLLEVNSSKKFGVKFFEFLIPRIEQLRHNKNIYISCEALTYYVWLRNNYPDYRNVMLKYLLSNELGFRRIALQNYETYSKEREISPLLSFYKDDYAGEISMCGDYIYELRDLALKIISNLTHLAFCQNRLKESYNGAFVTWYDWSNFLEWWGKEKINYL